MHNSSTLDKPDKPIRILVIRAGQLGDTVCASSIIEPLRSQFGQDCVIDWVAKSDIGKIFAEDNRINKIYELKNRKIQVPFNFPKLKIILNSLKHPYDYIVNLELGKIFNDVMRLTRAKNKIGMPYKYFAEPPETHAVENLKLIYQSFLNSDAMQLAMPSLQGTSIESIRQKFRLDGDYVILVTTNSHAHKKSRINHRAWPVGHWRNLLGLLSKTKVKTILIGSNKDKKILQEFGPLADNVFDFFGQTSFPELIGLIKGAACLVSTDTGPTHLAAAVGTPVIALIGPTNFKRTGPYKTHNNTIRVLTANLDCSPCYHTERLIKCNDNVCMSEIKPEMVMRTLNELCISVFK